MVFGIPTCETVRKARSWLRSEGLAHDFVDLREHPPDGERLGRWLDAFGHLPLRNTSGGSFRALPPEKQAWSRDQWRRAFEGDPMLLRRPVIERAGRPIKVGWNPAGLPD